MQLSIDEAEAFLDETAETFPAALFDERAEIGHTACLICIFSIDRLAHHLQHHMQCDARLAPFLILQHLHAITSSAILANHWSEGSFRLIFVTV